MKVQCHKTYCPCYSICSHADKHKERENCYNDNPTERTLKSSIPRIICPKCE